MNTSQKATARVSHKFGASAERVFDAWLDPSSVGQWLFATPTGRVVRAEIDARVGGSFIITDRRDGEDVEHIGEYLELDRPRRIAFLLRVPKYGQDRDRVVVDIAPLGTGCEVTITHELGPVDAETTEKAKEGWTDILLQLARALERTK